MTNYRVETVKRKLPYPFGGNGYNGAILAITSDIDNCNKSRFNKNHKLINEEIKLDVADSIFLFRSLSVLDLFKSLMKYREYNVGRPISIESNPIFFFNQFHKGYIDTIHSLGESHDNYLFFRFRLKLIIKILGLIGIKLNTWADHSASPFNFSISKYKNESSVDGELHKFGDQISSPFYHTNLTINRFNSINIRFAWHNISPFDGDDINFDYMYHNMSLNLGHSKYVTKDLLIPNQTRDGLKYHQFLRFYRNDYSESNQEFSFEQPYFSNLNKQINDKVLDEIARIGYYSSIGTHLGHPIMISQRELDIAIKSLKMLKKYQDKGLILVARTSRLMKYALVDKYIEWRFDYKDELTNIYISRINDVHVGAFLPSLDELRGLTFYVENPKKTNLYLNSVNGFILINRNEIVLNKSDGIAPSISIKWFDDYAPDFMLVDSFVDSVDNMLDCNSDVISSDIYSI